MGGRWVKGALIGALGLAAAGCATPAPEGMLIADPYEELNREIHEFNVGWDQIAIRPASQLYDIATPDLVKFLLRNVVNHIRLIPIFANYTLQGEVDAAGETLARFVTNTLLGGAGLLDPATDIGLPLRPTDFGVTLADWGVEEGPFIMLPIFGPSTGRDVVGSAVDRTVLSPTFWYLPGSGGTETALQAGYTAAPALDQRAAQTEFIDDVLYGPNSYTRLKAAYVQNRRQAIRGDELDVEALPDIFGEE